LSHKAIEVAIAGEAMQTPLTAAEQDLVREINPDR
jgi:hypothetical protein